jgi:hypothetical protein
MKTFELTGAALNWAVAKCEGKCEGDFAWYYDRRNTFNYSTDWSQGGPIIEREVIVLTHPKYDCWTASAQDSTDLDMSLYQEDGSTPLIAAMRCYVASKLGDEIEIPKELT